MSDTPPPLTPAPPGWLGRALLRRLAAGRLPGPLLRRLHERTLSDPAWRAWYHGLRAAERAAAGQPALSADQRAVLRALVTASLDGASLDIERAPGSFAQRLAPLALALACATAFIVVNRGDDEYVARGAGAVIGVRVRCVDAGHTRVLDEAEAGTGLALQKGRMSCPAGATLAVGVTNGTAHDLTVALVVIDDEGAPQIVSLNDGFDVPARAVDHTLPIGVRLDGGGRRVVFASFFERRIGNEAMQRALRRASDDGLDLRSATRLPIGSWADVRIDVDVTGHKER